MRARSAAACSCARRSSFCRTVSFCGFSPLLESASSASRRSSFLKSSSAVLRAALLQGLTFGVGGVPGINVERLRGGLQRDGRFAVHPEAAGNDPEPKVLILPGEARAHGLDQARGEGRQVALAQGGSLCRIEAEVIEEGVEGGAALVDGAEEFVETIKLGLLVHGESFFSGSRRVGRGFAPARLPRIGDRRLPQRRER